MQGGASGQPSLGPTLLSKRSVDLPQPASSPHRIGPLRLWALAYSLCGCGINPTPALELRSEFPRLEISNSFHHCPWQHEFRGSPSRMAWDHQIMAEPRADLRGPHPFQTKPARFIATHTSVSNNSRVPGSQRDHTARSRPEILSSIPRLPHSVVSEAGLIVWRLREAVEFLEGTRSLTSGASFPWPRFLECFPESLYRPVQHGMSRDDAHAHFLHGQHFFRGNAFGRANRARLPRRHDLSRW